MLLAVLAACGGSTASAPPPVTTPPPAAPPPVEAKPDGRPPCVKADAACVIGTFTYFKSKMCACTDKACADAVHNDVTAWGQEMATRQSEETPKPTEPETKAITDVVNQYSECMVKVMMPPQDPAN
jgi:hypothetical protein